MTPDQYRAFRSAAAVIERSTRACIAVEGADRTDYLQGLLTNDVAALGPGDGCYAAYLTPQGRMVADMEVFNLGDRILLDVDRGVKAALVERFDALIFTEDAAVADWSATCVSFGVHGPSALEVTAAALGDPEVGAGAGDPPDVRGLEPHRCRSLPADGASVVAARTDELGVPGVVIVVDRPRADALRRALASAGGRCADPAAGEVVRIESGRPRFPDDMDGETIPLEAGIEQRAISFTKGCYVGQEVVIRILHRGEGRVARKLVGLTIEGAGDGAGPDASAPARGASLRHGGGRVGRVTSAAASPALGRAVALGYLPRELTGPGTRVEVDGPGGKLDGVVTPTPFVPPPPIRTPGA